MASLDFEKLLVYQKALEFSNHAFELSEKLPEQLQSSLGDQLRRASLSVINNIAEGSGQLSLGKKRCFYEISLCSARECVPMIELLFRRGCVDEETKESLRSCCIEICKMLCGLLKRIIASS